MELGFVNAYGRHENESSQRLRSINGQDKISDLPNHIIGSILSFLPAKEAVSTCVLSKRWKNVWTFVTKLSFRDKHPFHYTKIKKAQFLQFVNRVLSHLNSSTIDSFSLSIHYDYGSSDINELVSFVSSRSVKNICFESLSEEQCVFNSNSLFECQPLEEFVMKNCITMFPSFASLSSLTSLKLTRTLVICFDRNKHLTLKFPVLRSLEILGGRTWSTIKCVTFHVPLLEVCSMDYGTCVRSNAKIKICASRLAKFCYTGSFQSEIILLEAVHIASANIMLYGSSRRTEETMHFVSKLLSINAASLKFCLRSKKVLERVKLSFNDIPNFQILGHLDLDFATGEFLLGMLSRSPCLETLVLKVQDFCDTRLNSTIMPGCFLFTLKVVKFERFAGTKHELNFAKLVMNNAQALERITFSCCPKLLGQKKWENVKENISSFKSTFSSVIIEFLS